MRMNRFGIVALAMVLSAPTHAGDAAKGEDVFKKCLSCHALIAADGTAVRKGGKTGPNLFGVVGRAVASVPDFRYSASITAAGATGLIWDEASLAAYLGDPTAWLRDATGAATAKSNMAFKLGAGAEDVASYLATIRP